MVTKSKPQAITVAGDNLAIVVGDETYYPHAGETVTFRGRKTVGDATLALKLQGIGGDSSPDVIEEALAGLLGSLEVAIVAWDWTDDSGEPYPSPPDADTLRSLSFEELAWLVGRGASESDDAKNA